MEGETQASSESRRFAIERSERAKGVLRVKTGMGVSPLTCRWGPKKRSSESRLFAIERSEIRERRAPSVDLLVGIVSERSERTRFRPAHNRLVYIVCYAF